MANDFVNTITTSNGTTYDVQDKRLTVTAADAGKVVSVDEDGNLTLTSGGTKLYKHEIRINNALSPTIIIISTEEMQYGVDTRLSFGSSDNILLMYYCDGNKLLMDLISMSGFSCDGSTVTGEHVVIVGDDPGVTSWVETVTLL